jgi:hypothetical protein
MSRHTVHSVAGGTSVTFLRTGARPGVLCLLLAGLLLAAACGHSRSAAQTLRTCVDRWNQGNMISWGPVSANVAFRRPLAKELSSIELSPRRQCIVAVDFGGGTLTCVLVSTSVGAYWCPPLHEPTGPVLKKNARIDKHGVLTLDEPLGGTHPTPPLAWQRYPHLDGFVEPWTSRGTLRAGIHFKGEERGPCVVVDETAVLGISCITPGGGRYDACFPQWQDWLPGELAACGGLGGARFVRWTITGPNPDAQELRTCADRWNQGNMLGWGPTFAGVGVALRRVEGGERSRCVVALAVSYKQQAGSRCYDQRVPGHPDFCFRRSQTYVCVMAQDGAYWCPPNAEGSPPLRNQNAEVDERGVLTIDVSLHGTHATPSLAWQGYPHVDGFVEPWTSSGTLRAGLRFNGSERGRCFVVAETVTSGISCLTRAGQRYDACFPQQKRWRAGELAACGELGDTRFVRWTITGRG